MPNITHEKSKRFAELRSSKSSLAKKLKENKMTIEAPTRPRYKLADLIAEMPEGLPRAEGWEEMPSVGLESAPHPHARNMKYTAPTKHKPAHR